jgi:hypothetical protein
LVNLLKNKNLSKTLTTISKNLPDIEPKLRSEMRISMKHFTNDFGKEMMSWGRTNIDDFDTVVVVDSVFRNTGDMNSPFGQ